MNIPDGYKLVKLRSLDGTETLVLIEDEFVRRVQQLATDDRSIQIPEPVE